ncbi:hypothetical protein BaRGS_00002683 [Batillaria attramentaria]|uniref:Uncharacterized protein n=1 Tax=Batillaria attramentaria TaxID=370345 RepID=A0ABD0M2I7_9CAEN
MSVATPTAPIVKHVSWEVPPTPSTVVGQLDIPTLSIPVNGQDDLLMDLQEQLAEVPEKPQDTAAEEADADAHRHSPAKTPRMTPVNSAVRVKNGMTTSVDVSVSRAPTPTQKHSIVGPLGIPAEFMARHRPDIPILDLQESLRRMSQDSHNTATSSSTGRSFTTSSSGKTPRLTVGQTSDNDKKHTHLSPTNDKRQHTHVSSFSNIDKNIAWRTPRDTPSLSRHATGVTQGHGDGGHLSVNGWRSVSNATSLANTPYGTPWITPVSSARAASRAHVGDKSTLHQSG